ncbi:unnamed protein product [Oikopleura dioica]|uniref:Uncharacterized protein n=1 Tax=Oikopleura dioica TaxID=34765 RepID=E4WZV1_OIKDI|nr:unnamed protein product [Oikopleura dioica]
MARGNFMRVTHLQRKFSRIKLLSDHHRQRLTV